MRIATLNLAVVFLTVIALSPLAEAADWLTMPSRYSHNPSTGQRVTQYTKIQAPSVPQPSNFRTSGYTHTRSSLNYGQSADNYHRVEQWGDPVRPYGEWRFPYRPYSTPYPNWGPPYAGLNLGGGYYGPYGPSPYDPYQGGGLDPGGRYPTTGPRGRGNYPTPNRGPAVGVEGVPGDGCCLHPRRCLWFQIVMASECRLMASSPKVSCCVLAIKVLPAISVFLVTGVRKVSKREGLETLTRILYPVVLLVQTIQTSGTDTSKDRMVIRGDATVIAPHHNQVRSIPILPDRERPTLWLPTMTDTIRFTENECFVVPLN